MVTFLAINTLLALVVYGIILVYRHGRELGELDVLHDSDVKVLNDIQKANDARSAVKPADSLQADPNNRDNS